MLDNPISKGLAWALGLGAFGIAAIGAALIGEKAAKASSTPSPSPPSSPSQVVTLSPGLSTSVLLMSAQTGGTSGVNEVLTVTVPLASSGGQQPVITAVTSSNQQVVQAILIGAGASIVYPMALTPGTATLTVNWNDSTGAAQTATINVTAS
jgi:hypothetical protein